MNDLLDTLERRADRASADPDVQDIVDHAISRGHRLVRRRRLTIAASSGVLVLGAAAALTLLVLDPAPQRHGSTPPAASLSQPAVSPAPRLVPAAATPKSAPVSLGLLPANWVLSGMSLAYVSYAGPGDPYATSGGSLMGKLVVAVQSSNGEHLRARNYPIRLGTHRAVLYPGRGNIGVSIYVSPSITIEIDVPVAAKLTEAQVLQLAASLTIRNTDNPAHG